MHDQVAITLAVRRRDNHAMVAVFSTTALPGLARALVQAGWLRQDDAETLHAAAKTANSSFVEQRVAKGVGREMGDVRSSHFFTGDQLFHKAAVCSFCGCM